jgi:hypothetical protein
LKYCAIMGVETGSLRVQRKQPITLPWVFQARAYSNGRALRLTSRNIVSSLRSSRETGVFTQEPHKARKNAESSLRTPGVPEPPMDLEEFADSGILRILQRKSGS